MAKKKYDTGDADGYRLRMVYGQWYFHLMKDGKWTGEQIGPMTYDVAQQESKRIGLPDEDRKGNVPA